ncbi:MAG TPA: hypothetical protein VFK86_04925, partial [Bauldia sp.]|nr:hypothetical protein [Bauldia sp.]
MRTTLLTVAAALLASPALADTLIYNANGIQVDAYGNVHRFDGLVIGDEGKIVRLVRADEPRPVAKTMVDAG